MTKQERWLNWAMELQSLAQIGLCYTKDPFDTERFQRIREISAEILASQTDLPIEKVRDLFCGETGYQTPKIDTRAAVFQDDRILLVQERNGKWSLPGGWCDVLASVKENTVREVKEESGLDVTAQRLIAVQDRARHNQPPYPWGVCKIFVLCTLMGGHFEENPETLGFSWFPLDALPELAQEKNTPAQISMCFDAYRDPHWVVEFD